MGLRLASAGYCGGDPEKVLAMGSHWVLAALDFEAYRAAYERAYVERSRDNA